MQIFCDRISFILMFFLVACMATPAKDAVASMNDLSPYILKGLPTKEDRLLLITHEASNEIASKLKLETFGCGIKGPKGIQGITLDYLVHERAEVNEARKLIVELGESLIQQVNLGIEREKLEYGKLPLSFFRLTISILGNENIDSNSEYFLYCVELYRDKVEYIMFIPKLPKMTYSWFETYQEAYQEVYGDS